MQENSHLHTMSYVTTTAVSIQIAGFVTSTHLKAPIH